MQRSGLEWLWRIKEEPALWQRYCNDGYILLKLIFTRVLPLWWISHNYKHSSLNSSSANVTEDINKKELLIELAGEWTNENAEKLGILFEYATRQSRGIKILMKNVSFVDSAFIGKTMLLQDYQNRKGLHFSLVETPRHIENILTLSCASYIINSEIN
jgi:N-acetylglucosaminyldiphosphoundecaprenol N-acetyl-beta-D-mannosaminyltransferase